MFQQVYRNRILWLSIFSFVAALLFFVFLVTGWEEIANDSPLLRYAGLTLLLVLIIGISIRWGSVSLRSGKIDLLELPVWYSLWTLVSIVLFGFLAFWGEPKYRMPGLRNPDWIPDGLWLLVIGLPGLWLGYRLGWVGFSAAYSSRPFMHAIIQKTPSRLLVWSLYTLIWAVRILRVKTVGTAYGVDVTQLGELSVFHQWLIYLEQSAYLVVAITALQVFLNHWPRSFLWWMVVAEVVFVFSTGFMKPLIWLSLVLLGMAGYARQSFLSRRFLLIAGVLALVFVILVPVAVEFRGLIESRQVNNREISSVVNGVFEAGRLSWGRGWEAGFGLFLDKVMIRQSGLAQVLGLVVHVTPAHIPHWGVTRLLAIPLYVIPRAVWPGKPIQTLGGEFGITYLGAPATSKTSVAYTPYGDLYLSAGWLAVPVGMAILGIVVALFYRYLVVAPLKRGDMSLPPLYAALAVGMMDVDASYVGMMAGTIQHVFVFGVIFLILHMRVPTYFPWGMSGAIQRGLGRGRRESAGLR